MIKKIWLIPLVAFILTSNYGYAKILNDKEIAACKNNPACFICLDSASNALSSCDSRPIYDIGLQKGNPANIAQLCSSPNLKEQCKPAPTTYENIESKTMNKEIATDKNFKRKVGDSGARQWEWVITNNSNDISVIVHRRTKGTGGRRYEDENRSFSLVANTNESVIQSQIILDGNSANPINIGQSVMLSWKYDPEVVLQISYQVKTILNGYKYTCASNPANPCMEESGAYYCNRSSCYRGSDIKETDTGNSTQDELQGEYEGANTCDINAATLFPGRSLSCRHGSATSPLKNCCKSVEPNEELKKGLKFGFYSGIVINPFLAAATVFGEILGLFGEDNVIKEWVESATSWLSGGVCDEGEITLSTLKASGPNDGNCIKLGEICSDYRGAWGTLPIGGKNSCWYTEIECDRIAEVYCCFNDMMAKATAKAGREQLGIGWGTDDWGGVITQAGSVRPGGNPCNPDKKRYNFSCRGLTIQEMVTLNLNTETYRNDIREYADHLLSKLVDENGQPIGKLHEIINDTSIADKLKESLQ